MQDIYLYYFKSDDVLLSGIWKTKKLWFLKEVNKNMIMIHEGKFFA